MLNAFTYLVITIVILSISIAPSTLSAQATAPTQLWAKDLCSLSNNSPAGASYPFGPFSNLFKLLKQAGKELPPSLMFVNDSPNKIDFSQSNQLYDLLVELLSSCPDFYNQYLSGRFKLNSKGELDPKVEQQDPQDNDLVKVLVALEKSGVFEKIAEDKQRTAIASLHYHVSTNEDCYIFYQTRSIAEGFSNTEIFTYFSKDYPTVARRFFKEDSYARLTPYDGGQQKADTVFQDLELIRLLPTPFNGREIISKNLIAHYSDSLILARGPFTFQGVTLSPTEVRKRLETNFIFRIDYYYRQNFFSEIPDEIFLNIALKNGPALTKAQHSFIRQTAQEICSFRNDNSKVRDYFKANTRAITKAFPYRSNTEDGALNPEDNSFVYYEFRPIIEAYAKRNCL